MERVGKHNRGHRTGCPQDVPDGFYGFGCFCEWLDYLDKLQTESGFHWKNGVFFKRLKDGFVQVRQFRLYNGWQVFEDLLIPAKEWASIISSVSATGETADTYAKAQTFHAGGTLTVTE